MSYTNAPPVIDGLRDALLACASWLAAFPGTGAEQLALATAAIHYPFADASDLDLGTDADPDAIPPVAAVDPTPLAVLSAAAGSFEIGVAWVADAGDIEALGAALRYELLSRYRTAAGGLVIVSEPSVTLSGAPTAWGESGDDASAGIIISGPYGLNL